MGADFITRIILDDNKFNDTMRKVRKGMDITGGVASGLSSAIKGMAGQIAAAAGVYEAFNTAINSNTLSQNAWNDTLGTAKESVDNFFTSLVSGDWSVWEKGVMNAISLSKNYTRALRNMKMAILVGDVQLSTQEKDLNLYENMATDANASAADRESAFAKFKAKGDETIEYIDNLSEYVNGRLSDMLAGKGIKADKNVRDMIFKYLDPSRDGARMLEEYEGLRNKLSAAKSTSSSIATNQFEINAKAHANEQLPIIQKQIQDLTALYPDLEDAFRLKLNFGTEEELDQLFDIIDRIVGYEDRLESAKRQIRDVKKEFTSDGKLIPNGGAAGSKNPILPDGSLAALDKSISAAKTNLSLAVDPKSRAALYNEIQALESQKHTIEFQFRHPNTPGAATRDESLAALAGVPDMSKLPELNKDNPFGEDAVKNNNKYADSLMTISTIMGSVTNMTGEGAAAWIAWGGNLLASIAAAIPAITSLIGLKSTEAVVNGVASATQTPLVGWLMAGAAAASVIGALMSIPKFATGGIVPGSSRVGDNILARVNSGEMILNTAQQGNLFNLLNGGGTTSSKSVEFKVKGKELVAVLDNYNNKRNKIL